MTPPEQCCGGGPPRSPDSVVITGIGLATPLGGPTAVVLDRLRRGETAGRAPDRFDPAGFACRTCAQVEAFDPEALLGDAKTLRLMNHDAVFAVAAARLALRDAGVVVGRDYRPERMALYGATGLAGIALQEVSPLIRYSAGQDGRFDPRLFGRQALNRVRPTLSFKILSNMPICFVSIFEDLQGPNAVFNPWEGQGAQAVLAGWRALQAGKADCALVGGCDVKAHELAFVSLQQQGIFRSWQESGQGCIPGEGSVFLLLERESVARARGARLHARLAGGSQGTIPPGEAGGPFDRLVTEAVAGSGFPSIRAVISAQDGDPRFAAMEAGTLARLPQAERLFPKKQMGNLFAAAAPAQLAVGALTAAAMGGNVLVDCFGYGSQQAAFLLTPASDPAPTPFSAPDARTAGGAISAAGPTTAGEAATPPLGERGQTPSPARVSAAGRPGPQAQEARRRVVITGLGIVAPVGHDVTTFWDNLTAGRSGTGRIGLFDASGLLVSIGGEVKNFDGDRVREWFPAARGDRDRKVLLGLAAAREAMTDAGLTGPEPHPDLARASVRVGVSLEVFFLEDVTALAASGFAEGALARHLLAGTAPRAALREPLPGSCGTATGETPGQGPAAPTLQTPLDRLTELLGDHFRLGGPRYTNCSACAAGAMVVGEAFWDVRDGRCDLALAGAADSMLNPLGMGGFSLLRALTMTTEPPETACRPFDATRDGTVLGEGGAFLVLESYDRAVARGAGIYAEILGYGSSLDAYRVSDPEPSGRGARLSMQAALDDAGLDASDIDCINAHGTGTPKNDVVETLAIKELLGPRARQIPVHAVKSMTGHMIAASGAVEALTAALTLRERIVPPTINLTTPDPDCDLDYVPGKARPFAGRTVLSNSFAFGGQNATLIFGRHTEGDRP